MNKLFLAALVLMGSVCYGQNVRYAAPFPSVSNVFPYYLTANVPPNSPVLAVCSSPANQVPCTNYATTFTGQGVACGNGAQDTPDPNALTSACQSTGDAQGNIGFWAPAGTYDYTVCIQNNCFGPYTVTLGANGSGSVSGSGTTGNFAGWTGPSTIANAPCTFTGLNIACQGTESLVGSLSIGPSAPTACGAATNCIASGQGSAAGTPTSGQNYFRSTSAGWVCSVNDGAEVPCLNSFSTHTEYAADYGLSDCGLNINAAAAVFTTAGLTGTIVVDSGCGTSQWSAVTIPTGVTLDMTAGGTYAIHTITFSNGAGFRGPPTAMLDGVNEYPALILRPNVSSGAAFLVSGNQVSIQNFGVLDGLNSSATGAGIAVTGDRFSLQNGNVLRFAGDGIQITSTGTSNQAAAMKMSQVMVLDNGGNAVNCTNTTDLFATNSEFENSTTGWGILETNCSTFRVEHSDISGNFLGGVSISGLSNAGVLNGGFNQYIGNDFSNNKGPDVKINGWDSVHSGPSSATNVFSANVHAGANGADNSYCAYNLVDTTNNVVTSNPILSITSHRFSYGICESFVSNTPSANIFNSNAIGGLVGTGAFSFSSTAITSNNSAFATGFSLLQNQYIGNFTGSGAGGLLCQNASGTIELCFGLDSVNILEVRGDSTGARIDLKPNGTGIVASIVPGGLILNNQTNLFSSGAGVPSGNCTVGSSYTNASASSASTVLYVCYPANTWVAVTDFPSAPETGDIIRYNVNGDNAWDAVNYAQASVALYAVSQSGTLQPTGILGTSAVTPLGSTSTVNATATLQAGTSISASASGSTNTVIGAHFGENGSVSLLTMQAINRWSYRAAVGNTTSVRYWMGMACFDSGGTGNNGTAITGTTAYATDTPNKSTIGFRFSSTTDTHWQAVAIIAGASSGAQTTVDTGVAPDTNVHLFEMAMNATGTSIDYYIDGVLKATIATNIPLASSGGNGNGDLFFTGDNKNTATAISETFYSMQISLKL